MLRQLLFICILFSTFSINAQVRSSGSANKNYADVTALFDNILIQSRNRFAELRTKWPVTRAMLLKDINFITTHYPDFVAALQAHYIDLESYRQVKTQLQFIVAHFRTNGPGDLKNSLLKQYNNGSKVLYRGQLYSIDELGNINYGVALKAFGYPCLITICAAGMYQLYSDLNLRSDKGLQSVAKFLLVLQNIHIDDQFGSGPTGCYDNGGDTRMIRIGYNWF
jgi:hypothetical protein